VWENELKLARLAAATLATLFLSLAASAQGPPAAIPDQDARHQRALESFRGFAVKWMGKLERAEANNRRSPKSRGKGVSYRGYGDDFRVQLKATGSPRAPYVGILRYAEIDYACADAQAKACQESAKRGVSEIFRFQDGRWVY